jgi:hypothetical protein
MVALRFPFLMNNVVSKSLPVSKQSATAGILALSAAFLLVQPGARPSYAAFPPDQVGVETPVYRIMSVPAQPSERWKYTFSWSGVPVASVSISSGEIRMEGDRLLEVHVRGTSNAFLDLFWRYRLNADGQVRLEPFGPAKFVAEEAMKRHGRVTRVEFDPKRQVRTYRNKDAVVREYAFDASNSYDVLSTVLTVLNLDLEVGSQYRFDTLAGAGRFLVTIHADAREQVSAAGQSLDAFRLRIHTEELTDPEDSDKHRETILWVSAERPRRLLKAQSKLFVGSVYAILDSVETLSEWPQDPPRHPIEEPKPRGEATRTMTKTRHQSVP